MEESTLRKMHSTPSSVSLAEGRGQLASEGLPASAFAAERARVGASHAEKDRDWSRCCKSCNRPALLLPWEPTDDFPTSTDAAVAVIRLEINRAAFLPTHLNIFAHSSKNKSGAARSTPPTLSIVLRVPLRTFPARLPGSTKEPRD